MKLETTSSKNSFKYSWLLSRIYPYLKPYIFRILFGFIIAIPLGLLDGVTAFAGTSPAGKIVVAGSSSVTPVMEKLKEAYLTVNPNAEIEIQESDSSTGMTSTIDGICDIGMASRDLKDSEVEAGLNGITIAMDGIAVIVNNNSPVDEMSSEQIKNIYVGEAITWEEALQ